MRIVFHSNSPWSRSGYGTQTEQVTSRMVKAGHEVAISCFWGLNGSALEWVDGIKLYPGDGDWGNTWLVGVAHDHGQGDLARCQVITLMDVWVLQSPLLASLTLASWVPVDHQPVPPRVKDYFVRTGATPIAMSQYGVEELFKADLDPLYVPHAINTHVFQPVPQAEARARVGCVAEDAFVVGMVANNQGNAYPRKCFPEVFKAFAEIRRRHDDAILYLHSQMKAPEKGLDLVALAEVMGVPKEAIAFTPEWDLYKGVDEEKMPFVFSQFDVLANPSLGEGFGIPIVEAQSCGVPVLVNDFSAMSELCGDGWKVGGSPLYDPGQGAYYQLPDAGELVEALEDAYQNRRGGGSEKARTFALDYDADVVFDRDWKPVLEVLERRIEERVKMPTVDLNGASGNRASRRRAAREKAKT